MEEWKKVKLGDVYFHINYYFTHNEMPDDLRKNLPDIDDLKKLL